MKLMRCKIVMQLVTRRPKSSENFKYFIAVYMRLQKLELFFRCTISTNGKYMLNVFAHNFINYVINIYLYKEL